MAGGGEMFDGAAAAIDERHRDFFADAGDARQVWARDEETGGLFYLAEGGVDQEVRDRCDAEHGRNPDASLSRKNRAARLLAPALVTKHHPPPAASSPPAPLL